MTVIINTAIMNLFNKVDNGTISKKSFEVELLKLSKLYGSEVVGQCYIEMLRHCHATAQAKIQNLGGK